MDSSELYFKAGQILPVRIIDLPIRMKGLSEAFKTEAALTLHGRQRKAFLLSSAIIRLRSREVFVCL